MMEKKIACYSFLQEIEDFVLPDGLAITPRMVSKSINPYVASSLDNVTTLGHWLIRYFVTSILFLVSNKLNFQKTFSCVWKQFLEEMWNLF